jgi:hypothetical protein
LFFDAWEAAYTFAVAFEAPPTVLDALKTPNPQPYFGWRLFAWGDGDIHDVPAKLRILENWCQRTGTTRDDAGNDATGLAPTPMDAASLDAKATVIFLEHRDWTKKQIAEHLGCHEKSLARKRCPGLELAMTTAKAVTAPRRGSKQDGAIEAWEGQD